VRQVLSRRSSMTLHDAFSGISLTGIAGIGAYQGAWRHGEDLDIVWLLYTEWNSGIVSLFTVQTVSVSFALLF